VTGAGDGGGKLGAGAGGEIGEKKWEGKKRMSTARDLNYLVLRVMIQYPDMISYPSLSSFIVCHVNMILHDTGYDTSVVTSRPSR
jgi:hypothetical protein